MLLCKFKNVFSVQMQLMKAINSESYMSQLFDTL